MADRSAVIVMPSSQNMGKISLKNVSNTLVNQCHRGFSRQQKATLALT